MKYLYCALPLTFIVLIIFQSKADVTKQQGLNAGPFICDHCDPALGVITLPNGYQEPAFCCSGCVNPYTGQGKFDGQNCIVCAPYSNIPLSSNCTHCPGTCTSRYLSPIYRFSGPNGDHYYSQSLNANANTQYGYENILGLCRIVAGTGFAALNQYTLPGGTNHYYTADATEASNAVANGYLSVGVICYVDIAWTPNVTYPVYRFYNQGANIYLLTLNPYDVGTTSYWTNYGVVGYIRTRNF